MKKKLLSVFLAAVFILSALSTAFAAEVPGVLKFGEDSKFTMLNICDMQDVYPMNQTAKQFILEMIAKYDPDLVVLGGDNTVGGADTKAQAIKEICDIFVGTKTYFTLVFGNHDNEQGVDKETLFSMYKLYGGIYLLAYDAVPTLTGVGTHSLPVMSSDMSKIAFNLFMFDSNTYAVDESTGKHLGYDCVHEDQIEWYKNTSNAAKALNGGTPVPAMAFQHIIVQEAFDKLFVKTSGSAGILGKDFNNASYVFIPKLANIEDGLMFEAPCPGYYNYGQLDAMAECGDVVAIFSGHDHVNDFTVNCNGIDIVNTSGCTYTSYGKDYNRGCRVIVLDENNPREYETKTVTIAEMALEEDSKIPELGDMSKASATLNVTFYKFMRALVKMLGFMFMFVK